MQVYTKKHLLEALKKAGLPHSYKSLLALEEKGIITRGGGEIQVESTDRFYTIEEINAIVEKVKTLKLHE